VREEANGPRNVLENVSNDIGQFVLLFNTAMHLGRDDY
jgi:hypothetical protein